jgi:hypothetical protein
MPRRTRPVKQQTPAERAAELAHTDNEMAREARELEQRGYLYYFADLAACDFTFYPDKHIENLSIRYFPNSVVVQGSTVTIHADFQQRSEARGEWVDDGIHRIVCTLDSELLGEDSIELMQERVNEMKPLGTYRRYRNRTDFSIIRSMYNTEEWDEFLLKLFKVWAKSGLWPRTQK